jgi:hypothetical protein
MSFAVLAQCLQVRFILLTTHDHSPLEVFSPAPDPHHAFPTIVIACYDNLHFMYVKMSEIDVRNCLGENYGSN